jgi:hypothetical protein
MRSKRRFLKTAGVRTVINGRGVAKFHHRRLVVVDDIS